MDNNDEIFEIGQYVQKRLRAKKIRDEDVAKALSIDSSTVRKIYSSDDIYVNRLAIISILLDEDVYSNFFHIKEPLKRFKDREKKVWLDKIADYEKEIKRLTELQTQMQDHINTQKAYIEHLEKGK